jgi:hypothetical protein
MTASASAAMMTNTTPLDRMENIDLSVEIAARPPPLHSLSLSLFLSLSLSLSPLSLALKRQRIDFVSGQRLGLREERKKRADEILTYRVV